VRGGRIWLAVAFVVVWAVGATMLLPLLWMVSTSLKEPGEVFVYPPEFLPRRTLTFVVGGRERRVVEVEVGGRKFRAALLEVGPRWAEVAPFGGGRTLKVPHGSWRPVRVLSLRWRNYLEAWRAIEVEAKFLGLRIRSGMAVFYLNSLFVAVCVTLGQVLTSALAGYAFARMRFPLRDVLFLSYLATMMVPFAVTMIPVFCLLRALGMVNTYWALILPQLTTAYGTFLMRQYFLSLPRELEEAAMLDGCGRLGVFLHVALPLSKPGLSALGTISFLSNWNSFMWPLVVIHDKEKMTLPVGLALLQGLHSTEWTLLMAASTLALLPLVIVYAFNQRFFMRGVQLGGLRL